jgi:hypothetical protein
MAAIVYLLATVTCLGCAVLLFRAYRVSRFRLLMWSALCFGGLFITNLLLITDFLLGPSTDLSLLRLIVATASVGILALGLAWESR